MNEENSSEEMPKLSIEQENEFKKMKLSLENGAIFGGSSGKLPPEVEAQFLDSIFRFEENYKNSKQVTVFERIGKPIFKRASEITDETELLVELTSLFKLLGENNIGLDIIYDYENKTRLIYTFITEELFNHEIEDTSFNGMTSYFTYEDFHQNHKCDLEESTIDFIKMYLNKKDKLYKKYHSQDAENHEALNNFRFLFSKFKIKRFEILEVIFDEINAKTTFEIDFWAKIKNTEAKISYSGNGGMTFKYEFDFWHVKNLDLPVMD